MAKAAVLVVGFDTLTANVLLLYLSGLTERVLECGTFVRAQPMIEALRPHLCHSIFCFAQKLPPGSVVIADMRAEPDCVAFASEVLNAPSPRQMFLAGVPAQRGACLATGARFLPKPINRAQLVEMLSEEPAFAPSAAQ